METLIAPAFNLAILLAVLFYYLKTPLKHFLQDRHNLIAKELEDVRSILRTAQEKYDEFSAKIKAVDSEVTTIRDQAKEDAIEIEKKIIEDSKQISTRVVSESKLTSQRLYEDLKEELKTTYGLKVVERTQELLSAKLTGEDRVRIREEFSSQIGGAQ